MLATCPVTAKVVNQLESLWARALGDGVLNLNPASANSRLGNLGQVA